MPASEHMAARTRARLRVLAAGVAVLAFATAGCGSGSEKPQSLPGASEQLLTRADVDRYTASTPERALLQWWRDAQYANATAYIGDFRPSVSRILLHDRKTLRALSWFAGSIRPARPTIESVDVGNGTATLYTLIAYRTPVGLRRFITSTAPQAFVLVHLRNRWLLHDDDFVQSRLSPQLQRRT